MQPPIPTDMAKLSQALNNIKQKKSLFIQNLALTCQGNIMIIEFKPLVSNPRVGYVVTYLHVSY